MSDTFSLVTLAVVWGLVFSFVNSFIEKLWSPDIFLKRFEPMLEINAPVWLTSILRLASVDLMAVARDAGSISTFCVDHVPRKE